MFGVTPETKKTAIAGGFFGDFEPVDSPYRIV
jgi:hypothetical protein